MLAFFTFSYDLQQFFLPKELFPSPWREPVCTTLLLTLFENFFASTFACLWTHITGYPWSFPASILFQSSLSLE